MNKRIKSILIKVTSVRDGAVALHLEGNYGDGVTIDRYAKDLRVGETLTLNIGRSAPAKKKPTKRMR